MKALTGAKIVLSGEVIEGKVLLFDEKIIGFCSADELPDGTEVTDASGKLVLLQPSSKVGSGSIVG